MMQLENFKYSEIDTLFVDFTHVERDDASLATALKEQYYR
jgi:DNA replication licensing factor MCM6